MTNHTMNKSNFREINFKSNYKENESSMNQIEEIKSLTFTKKIAGILISPKKTFRSIARLPDMKIPLVNIFSIIIIMSLSFLTTSSHIEVIGSEQFISSFNIYIWGAFFSTLIINGISMIIIWLVITFIFWIISKYLFLRRSFTETFKVLLHAFLPLVFSKIILIFLTFFGIINISINEGMIQSEINSQINLLFTSEVWNIYYVIDAITWFWSALLISFAIKEYNKIEFKRALVISYIIISIYITISFLVR